MSTKQHQDFDLTDNDLNVKADIIYRHSILLGDYAATPRDYGIGYLMSEIEIHTLGYICNRKGITVTQLAADNCRTKSAVSQLIKKLESKGLIERRKKAGNKKTTFLYCTEEGKRICSLHRAYDRTKMMDMIHNLLQNCTMDEIESFYKVMALRIKIFEKDYREKSNT